MKEHLIIDEDFLLAKMSEMAAEMIPSLFGSPSKAKVLPDPV